MKNPFINPRATLAIVVSASVAVDTVCIGIVHALTPLEHARGFEQVEPRIAALCFGAGVVANIALACAGIGRSFISAIDNLKDSAAPSGGNATGGASTVPPKESTTVSILQALEQFEQREQLYAEAAILGEAAGALNANITTIDSSVDTGAPQTVAAAIAAIEKADANLPQAAFINGVLSAGESQIDARLEPLVKQGEALLPGLVKAMYAEATALRAKASAL